MVYGLKVRAVDAALAKRSFEDLRPQAELGNEVIAETELGNEA
ncbi:MAG: hypothetical protein O3A29_09200 [Planctomycetota bacterium]|nr:hypothetical protein [Planctomycetota bacterium]